VKPKETSRPGKRGPSGERDGRERLLDAAILAFAERGIANTTIAQIASAGRVTAAMVHYWFDDRERLLDAIVAERVAPLFHAVWGPTVQEESDPQAMVRGIVHRMFDVTAANPWLPSLWLREIINEGGMLRERALRHIPMQRVAAFAESIARGKARGELQSEIEPQLVFNSVLALVMLPQATAKIWRRINPSLTIDRTMLERHVCGLLLHGIAGSARASRNARPRKSRSSR
jgi:AcrR family transcriptional regulator